MEQLLITINHEHEGVGILTLNRSEKRNALSIDLMREFCAKFEEVQNDPKVRVILVHGAGPAFCAGLDMQEACDPSKEEESAALVEKVLTMVYKCPCVTVAAVHGAAVGGGAGLMVAFDLVVAAAGTRFGFPEVRRGLVPAQVAALLYRQLRWRDLRELLLVGELVEADRALALGIINHIVPSGELMSAALKLSNHILEGAPKALKETKRLLNEFDAVKLEDHLKRTLPYHHRARASEEALEGTHAFLEKRPPVWN